MTGPGVVTSVVVITAMMTSCHVASAQYVNLLRNPGFEEDITDIWTGVGVRMNLNSTDKTEGNYSLHVSNRKKDTAGPSQVLPTLTPGRGYEFRANIKLLNGNPKKLFQVFKAVVEFQFSSYERNQGAHSPTNSAFYVKSSTHKHHFKYHGLDENGNLLEKVPWSYSPFKDDTGVVPPAEEGQQDGGYSRPPEAEWNQGARNVPPLGPSRKRASQEQYHEHHDLGQSRNVREKRPWANSRRRRQEGDTGVSSSAEEGQQDVEYSLPPVVEWNQGARSPKHSGVFMKRSPHRHPFKNHGLDENGNLLEKRPWANSRHRQEDDTGVVSPAEEERNQGAHSPTNSAFYVKSSTHKHHFKYHGVDENGNLLEKVPWSYSPFKDDTGVVPPAEEGQQDGGYSRPPEAERNQGAHSPANSAFYVKSSTHKHHFKYHGVDENGNLLEKVPWSYSPFKDDTGVVPPAEEGQQDGGYSRPPKAERNQGAHSPANSAFYVKSSTHKHHFKYHGVDENGNLLEKVPWSYSPFKDDTGVVPQAEEGQQDEGYSRPPKADRNQAAHSPRFRGFYFKNSTYKHHFKYHGMDENGNPLEKRPLAYSPQKDDTGVVPPAEEGQQDGGYSRPPGTASATVGKYIIAWRSWVTTKSGWITLAGDINAPMLPFTTATLRIDGPDPGCDFLIDNATFYEIPERKNWLRDARIAIDRHRRTNVTFSLSVPSTVPRNEIDIQVRLKKHHFAFGSKVEYKTMTEAKYQKYRDIFFNMFNWATIGSFKWRFDKGTDLYKPDFSKAMEMLQIIEKQGFPVRAHSILWGVVDNVPDAVLATPVKDLPKLISHHTQYMVNLTKGRVAHWDVQNELLHGHWYEETLQDPNVSMNVFKEARPLDPVPKLYLNDFTAVTSGANTEDYYDTAMRFIKEGTGIQGLGIQGHTKKFVKPDPTMMWRRLSRLAETGLELFMTEFDLGWSDEQVRADWFEDAIRALYAHPNLSGVILWGFWKEIMRDDDKYLVYGDDFQFSETGERFYCLVKKEWRTNVTFNMASVSDDVTVRGFQGNYEIIIRRKGVPVQVRSFTLGKKTKTIKVNITKSTKPIELTQETDFVPQCISHRDRKSLGVVTSTSPDSNLTCTDSTVVQSATSSSVSYLTVTCPQGSVMIGCSSYHKDRSSVVWGGEEIKVENGVATCSAIVAANAQGMTVSARCCRQAGLKCDYRRAGPSSAMQDAMAEARCPSGYTAAGCTVSSLYSYITAAFPNQNLTSCLAVNGLPVVDAPDEQEGSVSVATCCTATQALKCRAVTSQASQSGASDVSVTCPSGDVMTACQAKASSGGIAGSSVTTNTEGVSTCKAYTGKDHPEKNGAVVATAVCCGS